VQVIDVPLEQVRAYPGNPRQNARAVSKVAESIREFGWRQPLVVDADGVVIAGHTRLLAAQRLGLKTVPVHVAAGLTPQQVRAYRLADNRTHEEAEWDVSKLAAELAGLAAEGADLATTAFDEKELASLLASLQTEDTKAAEAGEVPAVPVTVAGDRWQLGPHRVLCGDSTNLEHVARLVNGRRALLLHADPPYGMGKEADGVANDNLYREELDRFQMAWWRAFRPHLEDNGSAYIWGNAADLWRLWYAAGLSSTERFELRNEIVWDKKAIAGMASGDLTQYPIASERCLFFQFGNQFLGNVNTDEFPETWEPLRAWLEGQAIAAGVRPPDVRRVCGVGMYSHWFTRAQFTLIPEKHYAAMRAAYPDHFARPWSELKGEWDRVKGFGRQVVNGQLDGARSYFDNAHDVMRDVWEFSRVTGEERYGHATPKPVAMMERVMRSSLPRGGLCLEPFGGTGATLMGAESTGRHCFTMELSPGYVDVIVRRWQDTTGQAATLEGDGRTFAEVEGARQLKAA
jgi:DNA modification methylase